MAAGAPICAFGPTQLPFAGPLPPIAAQSTGHPRPHTRHAGAWQLVHKQALIRPLHHSEEPFPSCYYLTIPWPGAAPTHNCRPWLQCRQPQTLGHYPNSHSCPSFTHENDPEIQIHLAGQIGRLLLRPFRTSVWVPLSSPAFSIDAIHPAGWLRTLAPCNLPDSLPIEAQSAGRFFLPLRPPRLPARHPRSKTNCCGGQPAAAGPAWSRTLLWFPLHPMARMALPVM